jgi:tetratricopeptide (TPR) repeat protein
MQARSPEASEVARLERLLSGDPGAPAFPALAEAHRRAGDPERAEAVARAGLAVRPGLAAGRVALGLALLDQGRVAQARSELERALEACGEQVLARRALSGLGGAPEPELEGEIERALATARPEREAMLDADEVAAEALRRLEAQDERGELDTSEPSPFATRTVAEILERQGEPGRAASVRRSLERRSSRAPDARTRAIGRLERWLARLRGSSR